MLVRLLLPLVVFVMLAGLLYAGLGHDPSIVPSPLIDKPVPSFDLPRLLEPEQRFTSEDLKGQVSVLNVWASWCPGCRVEHDVIARLAESGEVPVYGFNWRDERGDALRWLAQFGNPYDAIPHDPANEVGMDFGVYGAPETFLIDAQGRIRYKHIGPLDENIVRNEIMPRVQKLKKEAS